MPFLEYNLNLRSSLSGFKTKVLGGQCEDTTPIQLGAIASQRTTAVPAQFEPEITVKNKAIRRGVSGDIHIMLSQVKLIVTVPSLPL